MSKLNNIAIKVFTRHDIGSILPAIKLEYENTFFLPESYGTPEKIAKKLDQFFKQLEVEEAEAKIKENKIGV